MRGFKKGQIFGRSFPMTPAISPTFTCTQPDGIVRGDQANGAAAGRHRPREAFGTSGDFISWMATEIPVSFLAVQTSRVLMPEMGTCPGP